MPDKYNKIPFRTLSKIRNKAPSYPVSENFDRRDGYYGDEDEYGRGYRNIIIYVQNGLAGQTELFRAVVQTLFLVQKEVKRKYFIFIVGFGETSGLQHENKYFEMGYINDELATGQIVKVMDRISGNRRCERAVIPELFPEKGIRGKYNVKRDDFLIILGKKNEVFFQNTLEDKITTTIKKHILLIEVDNDTLNYVYMPGLMNYSS